MTELEERIIALIVEETGIGHESVQLDSRFVQDLGVDGDDAVEFFLKFGGAFHVDLTALWDHWGQHFLPEGWVPWLGCMSPVGIVLLAALALNAAFKWIPFWASIIALGAVFCWFFGKSLLETVGHKLPITVQDLVEAATSGKWLRRYEEPVGPLFRSGGC
jgi:acyl carrier protein